MPPPSPVPRAIPAALALVAAAAVVATYLAGLGGGFANSDEVIYAEFIRAMHRTGDYFTVRFQGEVVLQRPAAPIALYALAARAVDGELGMRLVPALLSALAALAAGAVVWRRTGRTVAGITTALLCAGAPTFFLYGRLLLSDPPYVLAIVGAVAATMAAQHRPSVFPWIGVALGAALGAKSLAAAVPAAGLAPWIFRALHRHPRRELRVGRAIAAFVALGAPFYVAGLLQHRGRFVSEHFGYNLLDRARGLSGIGMPGEGAYLVHMWQADGAPLTIALVVGVLVALVVGWRRRDLDLAVPAATALVTLVALSLVGTRLPHYLLVFYPSAAIAVGVLVARAADAVAAHGRPGAAVPAAMALVALALLWRTSGEPPFDQNALPSVETRALATVAATATTPEQPVYSIDWYAPALGYYADRTWRLLSTTEGGRRVIGSVDLFRAAGTVVAAPPWPSGRFVVAGRRAKVAAAAALPDPLPLRRLLAREGDLELWEAE